jgi:hypothetical protein
MRTDEDKDKARRKAVAQTRFRSYLRSSVFICGVAFFQGAETNRPLPEE